MSTIIELVTHVGVDGRLLVFNDFNEVTEMIESGSAIIPLTTTFSDGGPRQTINVRTDHVVAWWEHIASPSA